MLTFLDSGVLIAAARGIGNEVFEKAFDVIDDPEREFASSEIVRLEVLPKPIYHKNEDEVEFYEKFFQNVKGWAPLDENLIKEAYELACNYGLSACDSMNVAAAMIQNVDEFITTEKTGKPLFRVEGMLVTSIQK